MKNNTVPAQEPDLRGIFVGSRIIRHMTHKRFFSMEKFQNFISTISVFDVVKIQFHVLANEERPELSPGFCVDFVYMEEDKKV